MTSRATSIMSVCQYTVSVCSWNEQAGRGIIRPEPPAMAILTMMLIEGYFVRVGFAGYMDGMDERVCPVQRPNVTLYIHWTRGYDIDPTKVRPQDGRRMRTEYCLW